MSALFAWRDIPEWLAGRINDPSALRTAYQDAAYRGASDLDFHVQSLLWTANAEFPQYQQLAEMVGAQWPRIETLFWRLRAEQLEAATSDLLWLAFQPEWQVCFQQWQSELSLQGITLRVESEQESWQLYARVDFSVLGAWQLQGVPTAGYIVGVAPRDTQLHVIRSHAAFTLPTDQVARVLPSYALQEYKTHGFYAHPVARDFTSAATILANWDRWVDDQAEWCVMRCGKGGDFFDEAGERIALPRFHFDGLVGERQDGRARIRDYQRYSYRLRRDLVLLEVVQGDQRVALLYP